MSLSLAVSTAYIAQLDGPAEMVRALAALPIEGVEIDYRLKGRTLKELLPLLKAAGLPVVSLHHPVPLPNDLELLAASADRLSLSSPIRDEREAGLRAAQRTLELASDLEAAVVVFHLGTIAELEPLWPDFRRHYLEKIVDSEEAAEFRAEAVERRRELAQPFVERAMLALDKLLPRAERLGVRIALENRYHFHEVPSPLEIEIILETFRGGNIGYWHDTGHAAVQERVGFAQQRALLEVFGGSLLGVHLHDVRDLDDHLSPGAGTLDWPALAPLLSKAPIKVLEVFPPAPPEQVAEGIALLHETGVL
jgi:sugar phosphate isomerase/epimerase